jgi:uncharacterized protein YbgA (DUF1722 family)/uncharacterized protein YbbK (DUF523 family)
MTLQIYEREAPIRLGVSSCLLGQPVRFDGGHKRDRFVTDLLTDFFEWVPVCPEVEAGLGTPRPAMRLVGAADSVKMVEIKSGQDHTKAIRSLASKRVRELERLELSGYVLKKDSPSCGMARVRLYPQKGMPTRNATGLFAAALMEAQPNLPVEEEGRLNDAKLRENFIERVFAYDRLRDLFRNRWTPRQLIEFHTAHKLQLMAHSTVAYRELGRLVAESATMKRPEFREQYENGFMQALRLMATRGRNANVLQHAAGHLKKRLDSECRQELSELIHDYRKGLVPIVVPVTLLRHHSRSHEVDYLQGQTFLDPHPKELMLRNHV